MTLDLPPAWKLRAVAKQRGMDNVDRPRRGQGALAATTSRLGGRSACACGGACPRCRAANHPGQAATDGVGQSTPEESQPLLVGAVSPPSQASSADVEEGVDSLGEADQDIEPLAGNSACPVNAVFLSNVAGAGKANCQVPDGLFGAARLAQYIVRGVNPIPSGGLSVGERFQALEDPYGAIGLLKAVTATTDASGKFDDCYMLASKSALPPDFVLKVAQYHLYNGQDIGRNVITFTPGNVGVRHCRRKPDSCDFSDVCRLA